MPQAIPLAAKAAAYAIVTVGVDLALTAYAKSQKPDLPGTVRQARQARPPRVHAMGLPTRFAGAYRGASQ